MKLTELFEGGAKKYEVGDDVLAQVGGKWLKSKITKPKNAVGNYGIRFKVGAKTMNYLASDSQLKTLNENDSSKEIQAEKDRFEDALISLVRDDDDPELSDEELKAAIDAAAKKFNLTPSQRRRLALAAEGPIGY